MNSRLLQRGLISRQRALETFIKLTGTVHDRISRFSPGPLRPIVQTRPTAAKEKVQHTCGVRVAGAESSKPRQSALAGPAVASKTPPQPPDTEPSCHRSHLATEPP